MTISLNYQMRIGLAQYGNASNHRNFLGPYGVSPYRLVFAAMIYCLKHGDREAAQLLVEVSKGLKDREAL